MSVTLPVATAVPVRAERNPNRRWVGVVVPGLLLAVWWLATRGRAYGLIPAPADVVAAIVDLFVGDSGDAFSGRMPADILASMQRVYGGFAIAAAVALPLGMLIGRLRLARALLDPLLQLMRPIPITAWLPLSMILFGVGANSAFFLVALGSFFPILINTIFAVQSVEPRLFEAAAMLGVSQARMFTVVVLPASLPGIFTGLRLGLGLSWVIIVVGEMTGVPIGLGAMIMDARQLSRTDDIVAGMAVIGTLGFLSDFAILQLSRRLLRWDPSSV